MAEAEVTEAKQPLLKSADEWARPAPGSPKVFLSFHRGDTGEAGAVLTTLRAQGVEVVAYDPEHLWPDGPLSMLEAIVTQCHCIVYVGPRRHDSRFVDFEHAIAGEFNIPIFRATHSTKILRLLPKIREAANRSKRTLWPMRVSASISSALQKLRPEDFGRSGIVEAGRTGFDIGLDRVTEHHLTRIGRGMYEGQQLLIRTALILALLLVMLGVAMPRARPVVVTLVVALAAGIYWLRRP